MGDESMFVTCSCRYQSECAELLAVNRIPVPAEIPPLMSDTVLSSCSTSLDVGADHACFRMR